MSFERAALFRLYPARYATNGYQYAIIRNAKVVHFVANVLLLHSIYSPIASQMYSFYLTNVLHLEDKEGSFDKKHGDEHCKTPQKRLFRSPESKFPL